jgi:hypothetical protein
MHPPRSLSVTNFAPKRREKNVALLPSRPETQPAATLLGGLQSRVAVLP